MANQAFSGLQKKVVMARIEIKKNLPNTLSNNFSLPYSLSKH